jgi:hypothetical protein
VSAVRAAVPCRSARVFGQRVCAFAISTVFATIPLRVNAVENAGFATDLSSWNNFFGHPAAWDPTDASGNPASGSARISNPFPGNGGALFVLGQCEVAIPNQSYRFGARAQLLAGSAPGVAAEIVASFHLSSDCSDTPLVSHFGSGSYATTWERITGFAPANAQAGSIRVWIALSKEAGVDSVESARFDDVFLTLTPVFRDGFESP